MFVLVFLLNQKSTQTCNLHWMVCKSVHVESYSQRPHCYTSWDWDSSWNWRRDPPELDDCGEDLLAPNTGVWKANKIRPQQSQTLSRLVLSSCRHTYKFVAFHCIAVSMTRSLFLTDLSIDTTDSFRVTLRTFDDETFSYAPLLKHTAAVHKLVCCLLHINTYYIHVTKE